MLRILLKTGPELENMPWKMGTKQLVYTFLGNLQIYVKV